MSLKKIYYALLIIFSIYVLLDTFLLTDTYKTIDNTTSSSDNIVEEDSFTDNSYEDDNIKINIQEYEEYNTKIYVADIELKDSLLLKTAFANSSYGKNITAKTSDISEEVNAILAINGDYYGVQESGYVLKNGVIYRNTPAKNREDLVIYEDGTFEIIEEEKVSLEELLEKGAYNVLSFGPGLIDNESIIVDTNDEVGRAMASNPRTAIGYIDDNHIIFVVSDGRTDESEGLSLYQLATFMQKIGCKKAYNLDGGGSSTMVFNGNIINNPTTNGNKVSERSVSDIVYIGY